MNSKENPKKYTLKSAQSELKRLEEKKSKKEETLKALNAEIKEINTQIREISKVIEKLNSESLKKEVTVALFKGSNLTNEQISKLIELNRRIGNNIDNVDIDSIVSSIPQKTEETNVNEE